MLRAVQNKLSDLSVVLASTSPRRKEILSTAVSFNCLKSHIYNYLQGLKFTTCDSQAPEDLNPVDFPTIAKFVEGLAKQKAEYTIKRLEQVKIYNADF